MISEKEKTQNTLNTLVDIAKDVYFIPKERCYELKYRDGEACKWYIDEQYVYECMEKALLRRHNNG